MACLTDDEIRDISQRVFHLFDKEDSGSIREEDLGAAFFRATGYEPTEDDIRELKGDDYVVEIAEFHAMVAKFMADSSKLRYTHPDGQLILYTSIEGIIKAVPHIGWDAALIWSRLAIFGMHLFRNRQSYEQGGIARAYSDKVFPKGLDFIAAVQYWQKRIRQDSTSVVVLEAGFDASGPVCLTDAPIIVIDGATGGVDADSLETIEEKRKKYLKRCSIDQKWAGKGVSQELLSKIQKADTNILERKAKGHQFAKETGWVPSSECLNSPKPVKEPPKWERGWESRPRTQAAQAAIELDEDATIDDATVKDYAKFVLLRATT